MAVRIRLKKMGRRHRPYFRVCAMDQRSPRDGKVLEELGTYDPMIADVDARAILNGERINYWLGVGAQPSEKVSTLIKKYGAGGSHLDQQKVALELIAQPKAIPDPGEPASLPKKKETAAEPPAAKAAPAAAEAPAVKEAPAAEEAPAATEAAAVEEEPVDAIVVDEAPSEAAATEEAAAEAPAEKAAEKTKKPTGE